ncbi:MAG: hypothetical protein OXI01_22955 [Albidovulum sp.]|nr:hypothetical protein [Albidovulum sp.]
MQPVVLPVDPLSGFVGMQGLPVFGAVLSSGMEIRVLGSVTRTRITATTSPDSLPTARSASTSALAAQTRRAATSRSPSPSPGLCRYDLGQHRQALGRFIRRRSSIASISLPATGARLEGIEPGSGAGEIGRWLNRIHDRGGVKPRERNETPKSALRTTSASSGGNVRW